MTLPAGLTPGIWTLDMSHSEIGFSVRHAGISKVRGRFREATGEAHVRDSLADSSLHATVSTASFDSGDANRDAHVKGEDFFDVAQFPEMTFKGTHIDGDGEDYTLTGDLTIKGTTRPVTVDFTYEGTAVDPFGNQRIGFEGAVVINRKDWGVNWNAALEAGGVLVSEKVTLEFELSAIKSA